MRFQQTLFLPESYTQRHYGIQRKENGYNYSYQITENNLHHLYLCRGVSVLVEEISKVIPCHYLTLLNKYTTLIAQYNIPSILPTSLARISDLTTCLEVRKCMYIKWSTIANSISSKDPSLSNKFCYDQHYCQWCYH